VHLLCDYQVLASIPTHNEIACEDVADIVGLPHHLLRAVVGMTASMGFLRVPRPGYVAHTIVSAQLRDDEGVLDAFAFLADILSPCAVRMPEASRKEQQSSIYSLAFGDQVDYRATIQQHWRLERQALAHSHLVMGEDPDLEEQRGQLLTRLDWTSLGGATVVEVDALSPTLAIMLANNYPALSIVVQSSASQDSVPAELASKVRLHVRPPFTQPIQDASVYIVHLIPPSIAQPVHSGRLADLVGQLSLHLPVLRRSPLARIILLARVLPETVALNGSSRGASKSAQALALYHNLALHQLTGEGDYERADVLACVHQTYDADGVLVVTNELRSTDNSNLVLFEIQYLTTASGDFMGSSGDSGGESGRVSPL
jgi:hypothetical protein